MLWVLIALLIIISQNATVLLFEFRYPAKAVAWLFILLLFPFIGFIMWYFLAKEYTNRRTVRRKMRGEMAEIRRDLVWRARKKGEVAGFRGNDIHQMQRLLALLQNIPASPITTCNQVDVLTNATAAFTAMQAAIAGATDHIHLEFYTIRNDRIGSEFQRLLIQKAREGVAVRVLYDGIGSYDLSASYIAALRQAGVQTGCFLPPFIALIDKRLNYRNHRKIVVVDGKIGFMGGINIGDEYLGENPRLGFWRDTHFRFMGDSVYYLQHTFLTDWRFVSGEKLGDSRYFPEHDCTGSEPVQIVTSGPDRNWDTILEVYFAAITAAKSRVYLTTPYFIPDSSLMMALKTAAVSGVDIRVILPSVPDTKIVQWASLSYLDELLQAGVRFYRYQKGFIHAKVMIVDHTLAFAGTANLDMRSFYDNFEQNAVLFDRRTIDRLEQDFIRDLRDSKEVVLAEFQRRSRLQRGKEVVARLLSPLF